jgi:ubiquinone/menaquinone biosynthesis C-methylase UbiE
VSDPPFVSTTRNVYDFSADQYIKAVGTVVSPASESALDRAVLNDFADELTTRELPVLDLGCGPGRIAAFLHHRGLNVRGFDLSTQMIAAARSAHRHIPFEIAPLTNLPVEAHSASGAVLWYSIIHTPLAELPDVWAELNRVLQPNGPVLIGFQAGQNEEVQRENAYGSSTTLTWYRHSINDVTDSLDRANFTVTAKIWRKAELTYESTPQAIVLARNILPGTSSSAASADAVSRPARASR